MKRLLHWHFTVCNSILFILRLHLSRRAAIYVLLVSKVKKDDKPFISTICRPFGALEGTRIPGPLIKSQMLYRLSYERIFSDLQILPNNITTPAPKKQEESAKKCLSAAHRPPPGEHPFLL